MTILHLTTPTTTTTPTLPGIASPRSRFSLTRLASALAPALAIAGAATVVVGSYMAWATFYAGLVSRDGVAGHGKYFIGLAVASVVAMLLSTRPGVSHYLRYVALPAAAIIAVSTIRDIRNMNALIHDPAAGFYVPGRGDGLYVVFAGAVLLALAAVVSAGPARGFDAKRTIAAAVATLAAALVIPGFYGEYYLHISSGHVHGHTDILNTPHLLTVAGIVLLLASAQIAIMAASRPRVRQPRHRTRA